MTVAAIEARIGRRDWLHKRANKLPLSALAAAEVTEGTEAFQSRRLEWHARRAIEQGLKDPWIVLRRAGLGGKDVAKVRTILDSALRAAGTIAA